MKARIFLIADLADRDSEAMLIMANGRTFSVTDSAPKKLIMNTLARAAIERDRALDEPSEDERMLIQSPNMATLARQKKPARIVTVQNSPQGSCGSSVNQRPKVTFHEQQQDDPDEFDSKLVCLCTLGSRKSVHFGAKRRTRWPNPPPGSCYG